MLIYLLSAVLLSCAAANHGIENRLQSLEAGFQDLLTENQLLRNKVEKLENKLASHHQYDVDRSKRQPYPSMSVAFTASVGVWNLTNIGSLQIIVFDSDITNIGNAYDRATGVFKAPYTGVYVFTINMMVDQKYDADLHIIRTDSKSGSTTDVSALYADSRYINSAVTSSKSIVLSLNMYDEVFVRNGFTRPIELHGNGFTTFTGFMLHSSFP